MPRARSSSFCALCLAPAAALTAAAPPATRPLRPDGPSSAYWPGAEPGPAVARSYGPARARSTRPPAQASPPRPTSRRSHLADSLSGVAAPVAAAVGARGLTKIARDLVARRPGDVDVLDRVTRHVRDLFAADPLLATAASYDVASRIKTVWSVDRKLRLKRKDRVADLRDVAGLRVVVSPPDGAEDEGLALCYRVLRRLASSPHVREVTDVKDYIRAPKANGYRSLHATLLPSKPSLPRFEVQVRTAAMDRDAVTGTAAHREYKRAP